MKLSGGYDMKSIKNEYRINFYNDSISKNIQRVFIYADNDFQAMDIVMNTYNIPKNWIVKDLNNLSEKKVFNNLCRSKIFLSFSNLEGLGLPAIEAAIAGNFVVGYTGEGGKEYWKKPIFTEIYSGDIKNFVNEILKKVLEKNKNKLKKIIQQKKIIKEFSKDNEIKHIKSFLKYFN